MFYQSFFDGSEKCLFGENKIMVVEKDEVRLAENNVWSGHYGQTNSCRSCVDAACGQCF